MECGGTAHLAQLIGPEDVLEPGDVVVYLCGECAQRWDVVVDADALTRFGVGASASLPTSMGSTSTCWWATAAFF